MTIQFTKDDFKECKFIRKYGLSKSEHENFNVSKNELINVLCSSSYFVSVIDLEENTHYEFNYADKIEFNNILLCMNTATHSYFLVKAYNVYKCASEFHLGAVKKEFDDKPFLRDEKIYFTSKKIENFLKLDSHYECEEHFQINQFLPLIEKYLIENQIKQKPELKTNSPKIKI